MKKLLNTFYLNVNINMSIRDDSFFIPWCEFNFEGIEGKIILADVSQMHIEGTGLVDILELSNLCE